MKKFFDRDNFILSTADKSQRKASLLLTLAIVVSFILTAFAFVNFLYAFADIVGSCVCASFDIAVRDLGRSLPIFLMFFICLWTLLFFHTMYRNYDEEARKKSTFRKALVVTILAGINVLYILIMRIAGRFVSLVEGSPTYIYPLDVMLVSLIFVAVGVSGIFYLKKIEPQLKFNLPSRAPTVKKVRGLYGVGMSLWAVVAAFAFAEFFFGLFIIDFLHGYQAFSIALLFVYCTAPCFLAVWEFYFNNLKEEKRKEFLLPLAIVGLAISVVATVFYFVALGLNLDGPSNVGFGVLPIAFTASVNMATLVVVLTPLGVCITALIKGLLARKKKEK